MITRETEPGRVAYQRKRLVDEHLCMLRAVEDQKAQYDVLNCKGAALGHIAAVLLVAQKVEDLAAATRPSKVPCKVCGNPTDVNESLHGVPLCLHSQQEREATEANV